jgi:intracellular sulfur oxidation DsrE/DsrF family protein
MRGQFTSMLVALAVFSAPALAANESAPAAKLSCTDASTPQAVAVAEAQPAGHDVAGAPRVIFQLNNASDAPSILRFVTNYLAIEPTAQVAVVGYGGGIDFMLQGATDANGKPYAEQMAALAARGVAFKVCNNTLKARNLTAEAVSPPAVVVPGAVNEIIRLQTKEGYAYFRH